MQDVWKVSQRKACAIVQLAPKSYRYKSRRPGQAAMEQRIREISQTRVRYGYRRVHVMLRREGWEINHMKTRRIYNELGLQLRKKLPKRRVKAKLWEDRKDATGPHETWAIDFVHDQLATGRKQRILTVVDIFSRFSPVIDPRFSYRAKMSSKRLNGFVRRSATRRRYASIRAGSSSHGISTCGLTTTTSRLTSPVPENRQTRPSSKLSMVDSEPNASTRIGCCRSATRRKSWRIGVDTTMS